MVLGGLMPTTVVGGASCVFSWNLEGRHMPSAVWVSSKACRPRCLGDSKAWAPEPNALELKIPALARLLSPDTPRLQV